MVSNNSLGGNRVSNFKNPSVHSQAGRNRVYAGCEIGAGGCEWRQEPAAGIQIDSAQQRQ